MKRKIYLCVPESGEMMECTREERIDALNKRLRAGGYTAVWNECSADIPRRITSVLKCDGILLDYGWKNDAACLDEYGIALNHKKKIYHSREEFEYVSKNYVL